MDVGCGAGANTLYLGKKCKESQVVGIDIEKMLIDVEKPKLPNVTFEQADLYHLDPKFKDLFDGVVSFQTLSWLPDYKKALKSICEINPKWIIMSALFYEGKINYYIQLEDEEEKGGGEQFYNIYSIPLVRDYLKELGYKKFDYRRFDISIDLAKPSGFEMGTYTEKTEDGRRLQISGALLMPWYFIYSEK